jgi:hypothetical protein
MSITVVLTDELAARVEREAAERGITPDELARELLDANLPAPGGHKLSFIGIGASSGHEATGRNHREIIRDAYAKKTARDV